MFRLRGDETSWASVVWDRPKLHHFEHEEVVLVDQARVCDFAFEVGEALGDEGRTHVLRGDRRQSETLELVGVASGRVAHADHFVSELCRRNRDDALLRRAQRGEAVIVAAHDAGDERRFEIDHHVPRHRHHIGSDLVSCRQQDDGAGFQNLVDLGQRQASHRKGR
jgi:hypothetical protein